MRDPYEQDREDQAVNESNYLGPDIEFDADCEGITVHNAEMVIAHAAAKSRTVLAFELMIKADKHYSECVNFWLKCMNDEKSTEGAN